jgi:hypothetical protein
VWYHDVLARASSRGQARGNFRHIEFGGFLSVSTMSRPGLSSAAVNAWNAAYGAYTGAQLAEHKRAATQAFPFMEGLDLRAEFWNNAAYIAGCALQPERTDVLSRLAPLVSSCHGPVVGDDRAVATEALLRHFGIVKPLCEPQAVEHSDLDVAIARYRECIAQLVHAHVRESDIDRLIGKVETGSVGGGTLKCVAIGTLPVETVLN